MSWRGLGGEVLGEAFAVVQPGYAHTLAERRRRQMSREDPGDAAPPRGLDFGTGTVVIVVDESGNPVPH